MTTIAFTEDELLCLAYYTKQIHESQAGMIAAPVISLNVDDRHRMQLLSQKMAKFYEIERNKNK